MKGIERDTLYVRAYKINRMNIKLERLKKTVKKHEKMIEDIRK